jgi:hypothetical protein
MEQRYWTDRSVRGALPTSGSVLVHIPLTLPDKRKTHRKMNRPSYLLIGLSALLFSCGESAENTMDQYGQARTRASANWKREWRP